MCIRDRVRALSAGAAGPSDRTRPCVSNARTNELDHRKRDASHESPRTRPQISHARESASAKN
eukprot:2349696-Prymnesium_polylepis.1